MEKAQGKTKMKLTNTSIETVSPSHAGGAAGVAGVAGNDSRSSGASKSAGSDSVQLSGASQLLSLAKASASDRSAKVANVAALVRSGQYSTDTASVSHAVVQGHIQ